MSLRPRGSKTLPSWPGPPSRQSRPPAAGYCSTRSSRASSTPGSACKQPWTCPQTLPGSASQKPSCTSTTRSARSATPHLPRSTTTLHLHAHRSTAPGDTTARLVSDGRPEKGCELDQVAVPDVVLASVRLARFARTLGVVRVVEHPHHRSPPPAQIGRATLHPTL